jgi:hypothetical protein
MKGGKGALGVLLNCNDHDWWWSVGHTTLQDASGTAAVRTYGWEGVDLGLHNWRHQMIARACVLSPTTHHAHPSSPAFYVARKVWLFTISQIHKLLGSVCMIAWTVRYSPPCYSFWPSFGTMMYWLTDSQLANRQGNGTCRLWSVCKQGGCWRGVALL